MQWAVSIEVYEDRELIRIYAKGEVNQPTMLLLSLQDAGELTDEITRAARAIVAAREEMPPRK